MCKSVSDTFDPCLDVSLDINKQICKDLNGCLKTFVKPEVLQGDNAYKCLKCKKSVTASKQFSIHRAPKILSFQLKRFSAFMGNKINREVSYPSKLDIKPYMSNVQGGPLWYELYAVLVHSGYSCQSGHYYSYAKASNGQWYCFNDSSVYPVSVNQALSQQAYLLFYHAASPAKPVKVQSSSGKVDIGHNLNMYSTESRHTSKIPNIIKTSTFSSNKRSYNTFNDGIQQRTSKSCIVESKPEVYKVQSSSYGNLNGSKSTGPPDTKYRRTELPHDKLSSPKENILSKSVDSLKGDKNLSSSVKSSGLENKRDIKVSPSNAFLDKSCQKKTPVVHNDDKCNDWLDDNLIKMKKREENGSKPKISFKIKPFSSFPHHQRQWQKKHSKSNKLRDDQSSSSSNDSKKSDRIKNNYNKKLKMLQTDTNKVFPSSSSKLDSTKNGHEEKSNTLPQPAPETAIVSETPNLNSNQKNAFSSPPSLNKSSTNGSNGILSRLLHQSNANKLGKTSLGTWDDKSSQHDQKHLKAHNSFSGDWDKEFDRGRQKKVKGGKRFYDKNSKTNFFQKFQKNHSRGRPGW